MEKGKEYSMIIETFEEQADKRPGKVAVKSGRHTLTYGFLNDITGRLAYLINAPPKNTPGSGKKRENVFFAALLLGHDESMILAILGVLKAGHAYIPLDPTYPQERLVYMLNDSCCGLILTNNENRELAGELIGRLNHPVQLINLDDIDETIPHTRSSPPPPGDQAAYILYTSGSTGKPKGVVQTHGNIFYYIRNWNRRFSVSSSDRIALFASFCHDGSVPDIFSALLNGAALYPFDVKENVNLTAPGQWVIKEHITIWHSVPTLYRYFANTLTGNEKFPYLRWIVLGGEQVRSHDLMMIEQYFPFSRFGNIYGQTESTVSSIWQVSPGQVSTKIVIGKPIAETEILVVDDEGNEVDEHEAGEIVLAGPYLSAGYLNKVETTARAFSQDSQVGRLYWTGDLGRLLPEGKIEILGRKDYQVKIRGFRVEPGEIETLLLQHPGIREVVVVARGADGSDSKDSEIEKYLWAYFVSTRELSLSDLRQYLAKQLPDYMIPTYFVKSEAMPKTPSGKIDRSALRFHGSKLGTGIEYSAPTTVLQKQLTAIWQEVLKRDKIGIHDNFFELGGTSMHVIYLNNKLKEKLHIDIPVITVYRYLTISDFARFVTREEECRRGFEQEINREEEIKRRKQRMQKKFTRIGEKH
jgi:amino acid adenylation domain-containing protein